MSRWSPKITGGPIRALDAADLSWMNKALQEALAGVKNLSVREAISPAALDGEIFTRIRAMSLDALAPDSPLRTLFVGRRKEFGWRLDHLKQADKERIITMYRGLKRQRLEAAEMDEETRLHELESILSGMRVSLDQMRRTAAESEAVRDGIDALQESLENS